MKSGVGVWVVVRVTTGVIVKTGGGVSERVGEITGVGVAVGAAIVPVVVGVRTRKGVAVSVADGASDGVIVSTGVTGIVDEGITVLDSIGVCVAVGE